MKSRGYDLLVQVDEQLTEQGPVCPVLHRKLKASGTYSFIQGIPPELRGFTEVDYRIRLRGEPYLDFKGKDNVGIRLSVEVVLTVLSGVKVEVDVDFGASAEVRFDLDSGQGHL